MRELWSTRDGGIYAGEGLVRSFAQRLQSSRVLRPSKKAGPEFHRCLFGARRLRVRCRQSSDGRKDVRCPKWNPRQQEKGNRIRQPCRTARQIRAERSAGAPCRSVSKREAATRCGANTRGTHG